jgi:hypothetical protein
MKFVPLLIKYIVIDSTSTLEFYICSSFVSLRLLSTQGMVTGVVVKTPPLQEPRTFLP